MYAFSELRDHADVEGRGNGFSVRIGPFLQIEDGLESSGVVRMKFDEILSR